MSNSIRPRVIALCAPWTQERARAAAARAETAAGRLVLHPGCALTATAPEYSANDPVEVSTTQLTTLWEHTLTLVDEVVLVPDTGETRDTTTSTAVSYAHAHGVPVRVWTPPHLLEISLDGTWRLTCTGQRNNLARPCDTITACGCSTTVGSRLDEPCPHSPNGRHVVVSGVPSTLGTGCRLSTHRDLDSAVEEDIRAIHGPGRYLISYDTFYTDDLVLSADTRLDHTDSDDQALHLNITRRVQLSAAQPARHLFPDDPPEAAGSTPTEQ